MRIYNGDSRVKSITHIGQMVDVAIAIMALMMESEQMRKGSEHHTIRCFILRHLLNSFIAAKVGLTNLTHTYHSDVLVCRQLTEIIERQVAFIETCTSFLHSLDLQ